MKGEDPPTELAAPSDGIKRSPKEKLVAQPAFARGWRAPESFPDSRAHFLQLSTRN